MAFMIELGQIPPRERLAALLHDRMQAFRFANQRAFAAHLGLGLTKVNAWLNASGPRPKAMEWAILAQRLQCNGDLHAIQDALSVESPFRKGEAHG